jgi:hypothetical protein
MWMTNKKWTVDFNVIPPGKNWMESREITMKVEAPTSWLAVIEAIYKSDIMDDELIHTIHIGQGIKIEDHNEV